MGLSGRSNPDLKSAIKKYAPELIFDKPKNANIQIPQYVPPAKPQKKEIEKEAEPTVPVIAADLERLRLAFKAEFKNTEDLTERELAVALFDTQKMQLEKMAGQLKISTSVVHKGRQEVYRKLKLLSQEPEDRKGKLFIALLKYAPELIPPEETRQLSPYEAHIRHLEKIFDMVHPGKVFNLKEVQVAYCIARNLSARETANEIGFAENTINRHKSNFFRNFGIKNSKELRRIVADRDLGFFAKINSTEPTSPPEPASPE